MKAQFSFNTHIVAGNSAGYKYNNQNRVLCSEFRAQKSPR